jgi:hypothetical protein
VVGDEILIWRVEEGVGGSGNGDGGHSLVLLVRALIIMFSTFIGGVLLMDDECFRILDEGDLFVTGLGGELGESLGEDFGLVLADEPPTIVFPLLKGTFRDES